MDLFFMNHFCQIRVSRCQKLEGKTLSIFSITKLKGAKSVLKNCKILNSKETEIRSMPYDEYTGAAL